MNATSNETQINTYYGNMILRCVPVLEFLNNRYIEVNYRSEDSDNLLDALSRLFKFYPNPLSYVFNSLIYYSSKYDLNENGDHMMNTDSTDLDLARNFKKKNLLKVFLGGYSEFNFFLLD